MERKTNRLYKSRLFVMIFEDKKNLLELYNAVSGKNYTDPELMKASHTLREYAEYTGRVRKYAREMPIAEAVEQAITECIREGILKDFLEKNQAEAKKMSIYEYDQEKHLRQEREDAWEDGLAEGERIKLKELIRKKLAKGKSVSEIADILEEEEKTIQELIDELNKENV